MCRISWCSITIVQRYKSEQEFVGYRVNWRDIFTLNSAIASQSCIRSRVVRLKIELGIGEKREVNDRVPIERGKRKTWREYVSSSWHVLLSSAWSIREFSLLTRVKFSNFHPTSKHSISIIFNLFLSFSHPKIVIIIISCIEMEFLRSTLCCDSTLKWKSSSTIHDVIRNLSSSFLAKPFFKYLLKKAPRGGVRTRIFNIAECENSRDVVVNGIFFQPTEPLVFTSNDLANLTPHHLRRCRFTLMTTNMSGALSCISSIVWWWGGLESTCYHYLEWKNRFSISHIHVVASAHSFIR